MSTGKKILNVFGILFAILLSIVLVLMLIASPIFFSARSLIKPESIAQAVSSIDYEEILVKSDFSDDISDSNVDAKVMAEILSSDVCKEAIELYATDVINTITNEDAEISFTPEALSRIVNDNMDEAIKIVKENAPEGESASDAEIEALITERFDEFSNEIIEQLPPPEEFKSMIVEDLDMEDTKVIATLNNTATSVLPIVAAIIIISGLIFLCRLWKFKGIMWISINLYIATVLLALVCVVLKATPLISSALEDASDEIGGALSSVFSIFSNGLIIRTAVMLVCGIALNVGYCFIKKSYRKKEALALTAQQSLAQPNFETVEQTDAPAAEAVTDENEAKENKADENSSCEQPISD